MKRKHIKWNITVPIVLAVVLVLLVATTLALFTKTEQGTRTFTLSNFTSGVSVSLVNDGVATTVSATGAAGGGNYYSIPVASLENLHVDVQYSGAGVGLIRVKIVEEWSKTASNTRTVYPYKAVVPYTVSSPYVVGTDSGNARKWYDNRETDRCFYYAAPIKNTGSTSSTINLITGVDTSEIDFGAIAADTVRLLIKADVVQVNRYPQYWGITSLPWTSASSLGTDQDIAS